MTAPRDVLEAQVVGAALLLSESNPDALGKMLDTVSSSDFSLPTWGDVWKRIAKRRSEGLAVDASAVSGGDGALALRLLSSAADVPSIQAGPKYARELAEQARRQRLRAGLREADSLLKAGDYEAASQLLADLIAGPRHHGRLLVKNLDSISVEHPHWLLKGWLLRGALHMVAGRAGCGKSTVVGALIAGLSRGQGPLGERVKACRVGWLSWEEPEGTIGARLKASGSNPDRTMVLAPMAGPLSFPKDAQHLKSAMEDLDLIVLDGLGYAVGGKAESYQSVGEVLATLAKIAHDTDCAIIGVAHTPKSNGNSDAPVIGSTAWTSVSRLVAVVGDAPATTEGDTSARVLAVAKSNFAKPPSLGFTLAEDEETEVAVAVNFAGSTLDATDLMASAESRLERDDLVLMITRLLADGPMPRDELTKQLKARGFTGERHAVGRAIKAAGAVSRPGDFGGTFVVELEHRVARRMEHGAKAIANVPMCQSDANRAFTPENEAESPEWQSGTSAKDKAPTLTDDEIRGNVNATFPSAREVLPAAKRPRRELPASAGPDDRRLWEEVRFWLDWEAEPVSVGRLMNQFRRRGEANVGRVLHLAGVKFEAGRAVIDWETEKEVGKRG